VLTFLRTVNRPSAADVDERGAIVPIPLEANPLDSCISFTPAESIVPGNSFLVLLFFPKSCNLMTCRPFFLLLTRGDAPPGKFVNTMEFDNSFEKKNDL